MPSPTHPPTDTGAIGAERSEAKRLGYEAERRILAYLEDGDIDKHDSLHSDVQRLYQEMLTWRIACQRWTPGGSEFMDPAYCVEFIQRERRIAALNKIELALLRTAPSPATTPTGVLETSLIVEGSSVAESARTLKRSSTETEGH